MVSGRSARSWRAGLAVVPAAAAVLGVLGAAGPPGAALAGGGYRGGHRAGGFYTYPARRALARARPGDVFAHEPIRVFFAQADPARRRSAGPILLLQGSLDLAVPELLTDQLDLELCSLGDVVQYRTYLSADHDGLLAAAYPLMARWLQDRLAGHPAPQTCGS